MKTTEQAGGTREGRRLVIACGGTGGHLFPGIAVAEAWRERGGEALLIISEKQIDALAAEGYGHLRFERQRAMAMPPLWSPRMLGFAAGLGGAFLRSRSLLKAFRAGAVLGMGGFTSTAPLMAGRSLGLPTFIHESNAIPGRANRLNARVSTAVLVGFPGCDRRFGAKTGTVVGTPLRPSVARKPPREEALRRFGLRPDRRTLLVMGGSQGARRLNELVCAALPGLPADRLQVLHITGPQDFEMSRAAHEAVTTGLSHAVLPFCADMENALAAADLAVCRSGASTLTELAYYGLPAVLVPYPFAAHDHQMRNAEIFSGPGAAELWRQEELEEGSFANRLADLMAREETLAAMSRAMAALAIPDAGRRICEVIAAAVDQRC